MQRSLVMVVAFVAACGERGAGEDRSRPMTDARVPIDTATLRDAATDGPIAVPAPAGPWRGADCSASYAPRPDRDPSGMCFAPGGAVKAGEPAQVVTLSPFFVDEHEVTMAQFVRFLSSPEGRAVRCDPTVPGDCPRQHPALNSPERPIGCEVTMPKACPRNIWTPGVPFEVDTPPAGGATSAMATFRVPPGMDQHPARDMSYQGARAYCAWAGKALPTEAQWLYAATIDPATGRSRRFPWGDRFEALRSNCDGHACRDGFEESSPVGTFDGTGGRKDGRSPVGIHDAYGNVDEWTSTCVTEGPDPDCGECRDPAPAPSCALDRGMRRVFLGGRSFHAVSGDPPLSLQSRVRTEWDDGLLSLGFRCITTAAPPGDGAAARPGSAIPP